MPRNISVVGGQSARKQRLARRAEYRFGVVLVLLLLTFMVAASAAEGAWEQIVTVLLQGVTLMAALVASDVPRRLRHVALGVVIFSFVLSFIAIPWNGRGPAESAGFVSTALVAGAPVAIVWSVTRRRVIDIQTVLAALCVYVLIGMFFAFLYTGIGNASTTPFFAQETHATSADYQYFSFVTLTTTGYGDLTAVGNIGRAFAVLEALTGQIYLVTVVAVLVSNLRRREREPVAPEPEDS
jgi:ion channel